MNLVAYDDPRTSPPEAKAVCGICGGVATRKGQATDEFHYRGRTVICESWSCRKCETGGSVLRDPENGHPLRLSHVLTGTGFVHVEE